MQPAFHTIGIIGRHKNSAVKETLLALIEHLKSQDRALYLDSETAQTLPETTIPTLAKEALCETVALLIVVGGDGSLLHTATTAAEFNTPVLGINRGKLGFLTEIHPNRFDKIDAILNGNYLLEERFLLHADLIVDNKRVYEGMALNEIALIPSSVPHINEFEIHIDNQFVCSHDSDGLIVATPTGSTAYALSGGGPILHPELDALVLVPMFSHTLSMRPIVVPGNVSVDILLSKANPTTPRLSCDSQQLMDVTPGSRIRIRKLTNTLKLVHSTDYDYYESLRSKLHWGRKRQ